LRVVYDDPRTFLLGCASYDLILVGTPDPSSGQANRFYSREFFQSCARRMKPQGILAFRLHAAENFWTPLQLLQMSSIYQALHSVFPATIFLPGATTVITASLNDLPLGPEIPSARLREREIRSRLVTPAYLNYLYTNDRFATLRNNLENAEAPANTDLRPVCYRLSAMIWLAKFFPSLNTAISDNFFSSGGKDHVLPFFLLFILTMTCFSLCRLIAPLRRLVLMAGIGFVGMVLETVLILHYQVKSGVLYQDIGLLLTSFMVGLVLGPMIVFHRQRSNPAWGFGLMIGFFTLVALIDIHIIYMPFPGLAPAMVLLALIGLCVSACFAFISLFAAPNPSAMVSPLYAADLFGGCLGALISGLFLIPFFGLDITAAIMLVISASLLVLVG